MWHHRACSNGEAETAAAGITLEQAGLLDALFAGPEALVEPARSCSISELQTMYMRCAHLPAAWEALCAVWDVGLVCPHTSHVQFWIRK